MLFFKNNKNSLPQQVSENMQKIAKLEAYVKPVYYTRGEYGDEILTTPWAVDLTSTNLPQDAEIGAFDGFMISKDGKLFSIISIQYEYDEQSQPYKVVNSYYVCSIQGKAGEPGLPGEPGPAGPPGADGTSFQITGYAETVADLPAVGQIGDAYAVGTNDPRDIYVWVTSPEPEWINLGSMQGPKGDTGATGPQGPKGDPGSGGEAVVANHIKTNMELPNLVIKTADKILPNTPFQDYDITADIINMNSYTLYFTQNKKLVSTNGVDWSPTSATGITSYSDYIGRNMIPCYGKDYAFIVDSGQLKMLHNTANGWTFTNVTTTLDITGDTLVNFDKTKFAYIYPDYLYMVSSGGNFYGADLSNFDPTSPQIDFVTCTSSVSNIDPSKIWSTYKNSEGCIFYNDGSTDYYADLYNESDIDWNSFTWDSASISFNPQTEIKYCMVSGSPLTAVMLYGENYVPYVDPANQSFGWTQYNPDPVGGATITGYQCFWTPQHIIWQNSSSSPYTYYSIDVQNNKATKLDDFGIVVKPYDVWTDGIYYYCSHSLIAGDNYVLKNNKWVNLGTPIPPQAKYRVGNLLMGNYIGQTTLYLFDPDTLTFSSNNISNNTGRAFDFNVFELFGNWYYTLVDGANLRHVYKFNVTLNNDVYEVRDTDVTNSFSSSYFVGANVWKYGDKYYVYSSSNWGEITEDNGTFTINWKGTGGFDKIFFSKVGVLGYKQNSHTFYKFNGTDFELFYTLTDDDLSLDSFSNFGPTIINDKLYFRDIEILTQLDLKYTN